MPPLPPTPPPIEATEAKQATMSATNAKDDGLKGEQKLPATIDKFGEQAPSMSGRILHVLGVETPMPREELRNAVEDTFRTTPPMKNDRPYLRSNFDNALKNALKEGVVVQIDDKFMLCEVEDEVEVEVETDVLKGKSATVAKGRKWANGQWTANEHNVFIEAMNCMTSEPYPQKWKIISLYVKTRSPDQCRVHAGNKGKAEKKKEVATAVGYWSLEEHSVFIEAMNKWSSVPCPQKWKLISDNVETRSPAQCRRHVGVEGKVGKKEKTEEGEDGGEEELSPLAPSGKKEKTEGKVGKKEKTSKPVKKPVKKPVNKRTSATHSASRRSKRTCINNHPNYKEHEVDFV